MFFMMLIIYFSIEEKYFKYNYESMPINLESFSVFSILLVSDFLKGKMINFMSKILFQ